MLKLIADTYEKIIIFLLVIQYAFVNIVFTTGTQNIVIMKDLSAPLFSMLIFFFWVVGDLAKHGKWELPKNGIVPATVAALLFWMTSVIAGSTTPAGIYIWGAMWGYFVQTWALVRFLNSYKLLSFFMHTIIWTNVLLVGYGLSQIMNSDILVALNLIPSWGDGVFVSTHGNQNFFAGYLICTYPIILGFWLVTRNPFFIFALPILVGLNLYEVIHSTARGAYLAVAAHIPLLALGLGLNWRNLHIVEDAWRKRIFQATAVVLVIGVILGSVLHYEKVAGFAGKIYNQYYSIIDYEAQYTNWVRLVFFQMAFDGTLRHPLLGRGIGGFNQHMPETRMPWYHRWGVSHNTDHPHNEHLEWLHDTGIIGLGFFWLILVVYFHLGMRQIWRHRKGYYFPLVLSAFFGPWNQWIQASFDVETRWTGNNVTLWFGVGLVLAFCNLPVILRREELVEKEETLAQPVAGKGKKSVRPLVRGPVYRTHPWTAWVAGTMALVIVYYCVKARHFWLADYHLARNMAFTDGTQGPGTREALKDAERARALNWSNMSLYYKLAYTYLVAGQMENAMEAYRDLQSLAPNYAQIHVNLAYLNDQLRYRTAAAWERDRSAIIEHNNRNHRDAASYWLQLGYPTRALHHLRMCFTIETDRFDDGYYFWFDRGQLHVDLARVYASIGRVDQARRELEDGLRFNPGNVQAAVLLAEVLAQQGQKEASDALLADLTRKAPNNPALLVLSIERAMRTNDYAAAINFADEAAKLFTLPAPGAQPPQEAVEMGNQILEHLQALVNANHDRARAFGIAGWIIAAQGRYQEAENFLAQAYAARPDPVIEERLGLVKARLRI